MGEGMTLERLRVIIEAYTQPYREELERVKNQTSRATQEVDRQTTKMAKSYNKVGRAVKAVIGALSIGAIIAFGKSCVDLGSDLQEVQNVVDVTFGSINTQVDAFAKNAITQFGLSETMAKKYMGTYGAMAKAFGYSTEQAYDMSASITGLTGDVASFYNLSQDEAYTKLKSIFTGETESLKDLGVVMTQTALDQYALNNGFGRTTAQMTEQEKVMLRYQFVMAQLSAAQGDFARTSDSWANQVRILQLQFDSLKATIGQGLINALTPVIKIINSIIGKLQVAAEVFRQFTSALFGDAGGGSGAISDSIASGTASADTSTGNMADNLTESAKQAKKIENVLMGFDRINKLPDAADSGSTGGLGNADSLVPGMSDLTNIGNNGVLDKINKGLEDINETARKAAEKVRSFFVALKKEAEPTIEAVKRLWEALKPFGTFVATGLKDFYEHLLVPIGNWLLGEDGLPRFFDILTGIAESINWPNLNTSLKELWDRLAPFAIHIGEGLMWFLENVLAPLAAWTISDLLTAFLDLLAALIGALDAIIQAAAPSMSWLFQNFLIPIAQWTGGVILSVLEWLTQRLTDFSNWAKNNKQAVENMATVVIGFLAGIVTYYTVKNICGVIQSIKDGFQGLATIFHNVNIKGVAASVAIGLLVAGILLIAENWSKMNDLERVVSVLGVIAVAAAGAAIAFGALQSALSLGIAAFAIVGGIAAITAAISSAQSRAESGMRSINSGSVRQFASGGFPEQGEVFVAREAGPEMVGRMGNRNVVANNNQIVAGIRQGVYEAVVNANSANSSKDRQPAVINVYVGNKKMSRSVIDDINSITQSTGCCPIHV
ncbi:hypothetical protein [Murimonas intestini]|uniref:hypothetical protein n=1 Tax=Murimonas intestini TaxID=1337051 RepID=UPI00248CABBF|nr:hypothetical protein [Murimonas intestini]